MSDTAPAIHDEQGADGPLAASAAPGHQPSASAPSGLRGVVSHSAEHTPGPWFAVVWQHSVGICTSAKGTYGNRVAECFHWTPAENGQPDRAASVANARLIAAAPELLEEAAFLLDRIAELDWCDFDQFTREWLGHVDPPLERLKAALAKARGDV